MNETTLNQVIGQIEFAFEDAEELSKTMKCKELSQAITNLELAQMWLEKLKKRLG